MIAPIQIRSIVDVLRDVGVSSFEYQSPDGESFKVTLAPAATAAQPSTPELTGNAGALMPDPPKTDVFDVIESQRAPGAPGPDGLPGAAGAG